MYYTHFVMHVAKKEPSFTICLAEHLIYMKIKGNEG